MKKVEQVHSIQPLENRWTVPFESGFSERRLYVQNKSEISQSRFIRNLKSFKSAIGNAEFINFSTYKFVKK